MCIGELSFACLSVVETASFSCQIGVLLKNFHNFVDMRFRLMLPVAPVFFDEARQMPGLIVFQSAAQLFTSVTLCVSKGFPYEYICICTS